MNNVKSKLNMIGYGKEFVVIFTKSDGTQRKMRCMMEPPKGPQKNPDVVPVMDLDAGGWRSFNVTKVISLEETVV